MVLLVIPPKGRLKKQSSGLLHEEQLLRFWKVYLYGMWSLQVGRSMWTFWWPRVAPMARIHSLKQRDETEQLHVVLDVSLCSLLRQQQKLRHLEMMTPGWWLVAGGANLMEFRTNRCCRHNPTPVPLGQQFCQLPAKYTMSQ